MGWWTNPRHLITTQSLLIKVRLWDSPHFTGNKTQRLNRLDYKVHCISTRKVKKWGCMMMVHRTSRNVPTFRLKLNLFSSEILLIFWAAALTSRTVECGTPKIKNKVKSWNDLWLHFFHLEKTHLAASISRQVFSTKHLPLQYYSVLVKWAYFARVLY